MSRFTAQARVAVPFMDLRPMHDGLKARLLAEISDLVDAGSFTNGPQVAELRSEEHTSELQSPDHLVCRLLLEKKKKKKTPTNKHKHDEHILAQYKRQRQMLIVN